MNTRNFKISTYLRCAICAAVALCGPPICDPTEKTSSSDIVPSFVSCWSATRFAILLTWGIGGTWKGLSTNSFKPQISNQSKYDVLHPFWSAPAKAKKSRGVEEREREAAFGRGARSSKLLRCSSCFHHLQKFPCVTRAFEVFRDDAVLPGSTVVKLP